MKKWRVTIKCEQNVPDEELNEIDLEEANTGTQTFELGANNQEEAEESALDQWHSENPIKVLDDYNIWVWRSERIA